MATPREIPAALYRAAQFFAALRAGLPGWAGGKRVQDDGVVAAVLVTAAQRQLFDRMPANDRRHALAVARTLQETGFDHPALLQAALLHDVGKSIGQPLPHRVLIVLLEAFWPAALAWLSSLNARGRQPASLAVLRVSAWRRPFVVHARHPVIGAIWADEVGCDPLAVRLIARHQDKLDHGPGDNEDKLLAALQRADNLN